MMKQLTGKILAMGLMMGAAESAHAAATYGLTCEASRGQSFTIALTSFSFHVGAATSAATGAASGKRDSSELLIRFPVSKEYDVLLGAAEEDEVLRSCRLTVTTGSMAATDNWNQMAATKGKGNKANKISKNGDGAKLFRQLCREGSADDGAVSGGAAHAARGIAGFSDPVVRRRRRGEGAALRGVPDLREGVPAALHSY
jgi:hypothetical protein